MSKHTEGPWKHSTTYSVYGQNKMVASVYGDDPECKPDDRLKANATLIAAAPELLEALIDCRRTLEIANFTQELAVVNAAIAKAKGEV